MSLSNILGPRPEFVSPLGGYYNLGGEQGMGYQQPTNPYSALVGGSTSGPTSWTGTGALGNKSGGYNPITGAGWTSN